MELKVTRSGSITDPVGFEAAAVAAGIKPSGKSDMALVVNRAGCVAAGVFTRNKIVASPVKLTHRALADGSLRAVVFNSGNANACNGSVGDRNASEEQSLVAELVGVDPGEVGVCSTGLLGEQLPMSNVRAGIAELSRSVAGDAASGHAAAEAILTTDTCTKEVVVESDGWKIAGMAKGVGMMAPSLATMLVLLTTDAVVSSTLLQRAWGCRRGDV